MKQSAPVIIGALLYLVLVATLELYSPFLLINEKFLLAHSTDDHGKVAIKLRQINQHHGRNDQLVLALGSSSFREAFESDDQVQTQLFGKMAFKNLSTSSQSLMESLVISNALNSFRHVTLLVGVNIHRFTDSKEDLLSLDKFGFSYPRRSDIRLDDHTLQNSFWASLEFSQILLSAKRYLSNNYKEIFRELRLKENTYTQHQYDKFEEWPISEKQRALNEIGAISEKLEKNFAINLSALNELLDFSLERGWRLVLVELPMSPEYSRLVGKQNRFYSDKLEAWSKTRNVPYYIPQRSLSLTNNDFFDFVHLRPTARNLYQKKLIESLWPKKQ